MQVLARTGIELPNLTTDPFTYRAHLASIANALEQKGVLFMAGSTASRPAAGIAGRAYLDTTRQVVQWDTGITWLDLNPPIPVNAAAGTPALRSLGTDANQAAPGVHAAQHAWNGADPLQGLVPPGALVPYAGSTSPPGWLIADGATVNRVTYAALFTAIGTAYGSGDGSTTFGLPDLRGRVPVGVDAGAGRASGAGGRGAAGGAQAHTLTDSEIPAHQHAFPYAVAGVAVGTGTNNGMLDPNAHTVNTSAQTATVGSGQPHNNMPPFLTITFLIKT